MFDPTALALREQFGTREQQRETATDGMWIFLATEVLLFGGLFTCYTVYHNRYPVAFELGSADMNLTLGAVNTAVLITSSLTMALSIYSAAVGKSARTVFYLMATMLLGLAFLGIKFTEYYQHYMHHKAPGFDFIPSTLVGPEEQLFFLFYFIMTGLHAAHMIIGIGLLSVFTVRAALGSFDKLYYTPLEAAGLYWHFVDIVWVFLYAIFYLQGAGLHHG